MLLTWILCTPGWERTYLIPQLTSLDSLKTRHNYLTCKTFKVEEWTPLPLFCIIHICIHDAHVHKYATYTLETAIMVTKLYFTIVSLWAIKHIESRCRAHSTCLIRCGLLFQNRILKRMFRLGTASIRKMTKVSPLIASQFVWLIKYYTNFQTKDENNPEDKTFLNNACN